MILTFKRTLAYVCNVTHNGKSMTAKIDPNYRYYLNNVAWPLALPLVDKGIAMYTFRADYSLLSNRQTYAAIYYVCENKLFKLIVKSDKNCYQS